MLLYDIQDFITRSVKNDTVFNDKVNDYYSKDMSYFVDAHILDESEDMPSFVSYGLEVLSEARDDFYIVQFIITSLVENQSIEDDGVKIYPTKKILEELANDSLLIINREIRAVGIKGNCNIKVAHHNLSMSYVGEAEDIQVIVTLRLEEKKFI